MLLWFAAWVNDERALKAYNQRRKFSASLSDWGFEENLKYNFH